jgi:hypothetical protein
MFYNLVALMQSTLGLSGRSNHTTSFFVSRNHHFYKPNHQLYVRLEPATSQHSQRAPSTYAKRHIFSSYELSHITTIWTKLPFPFVRPLYVLHMQPRQTHTPNTAPRGLEIQLFNVKYVGAGVVGPFWWLGVCFRGVGFMWSCNVALRA